MTEPRTTLAARDAERVTHWERLPWHWISTGVGAAAALGDVGAMLLVGVEMKVGGTDATYGVLALLTATYAFMGYVIGRLLQQRARSKRESAIIARQLRELAQQEKMAAIGRVAAGVAHEVRNPLGVIRASASMVQESFDPGEDPHRACEFICEEIDRLNSLITALLTFSRPTELKLQPVTICKVVDRALTLAHDDLQRRGIEIQRIDASNLPGISLDPDLVSQVVYGLVSNAGEAIGQNGCIAVRSSSDDGVVRVEVADSGDGIEANVAAHVFEPFFTTKATGTGLGLAMAERIVHAHGGTLTVVPGQGAGPGGRGACFRLELPIQPTPPMCDAAGAAVRALEAARKTSSA